MYVFNYHPHATVLTKFGIDRGLAVVFAEDIPDTAQQNPVPGTSVRSPKLMLINGHFADAWKKLCPPYA